MRARRSLHARACAACGADGDCPTNESPAFLLGTGDAEFAEVDEEHPLDVQRGSQGGCHLPLAFRTTGYAPKRFTVAYTLTLADSGVEMISTRQTTNLTPATDGSGDCELLGFRAFVRRHGSEPVQRISVDVTVTDEQGRTGRLTQIVRADWTKAGVGAPGQDPCANEE